MTTYTVEIRANHPGLGSPALFNEAIRANSAREAEEKARKRAASWVKRGSYTEVEVGRVFHQIR